MIDYSQPSFYHFSSDSIWLASQVSDYLKNYRKQHLNILDLCSGCGVIALESLVKSDLENIKLEITFLEREIEFKKHIEKNCQEYLNYKGKPNLEVAFEIDIISMGEEIMKQNRFSYDLIVSNPPYFIRGSGRKSPNIKKNGCRFFEVDDLSIFAQLIKEKLKVNGVSFFIGPFSLLQIRDLFGENFNAEIVDKRGRINLFQLGYDGEKKSL